jgi:hypothetical protein
MLSIAVRHHGKKARKAPLLSLGGGVVVPAGDPKSTGVAGPSVEGNSR